MTIEHYSQAAAVSTKPTNMVDIQPLKQQLTVLSEQVAALSIQCPAQPQGWREPRKWENSAFV